MTVVCPDVSEFQVPLSSAYARDFVILRALFGSAHMDNNFLPNAGAAKALYNRGTLDGAALYQVPLGYLSAQSQASAMWRLIGPSTPPWLAGIVLDVEAWRGTDYAMSGDHSRLFNALYGIHAARLGWNGVIGYGNAGDLAELWPHRDPRCRVIVADYTNRIDFRGVRGAIGQQYTNGQTRPPPGLPTSTAPFGHCDHNVFPGFANGAKLRAALHPDPRHAKPVPIKPPAPRPAPVPQPSQEESMTPAESKQLAQDSAAALMNYELAGAIGYNGTVAKLLYGIAHNLSVIAATVVPPVAVPVVSVAPPVAPEPPSAPTAV